MKAELVPENGDRPIPIVRDLTVVGRREYCDVCIDDPSLSKRHCVIVKTDGLLVVRDLATTNGTKVKGQRIRWAALLPDDRLTLGAYKFRVYLGPDDIPAPSERWAARSAHARPAPVSARVSAPTRTAAKVAPGGGYIPPASPSNSGFPAPSPLGIPALAPQSHDDLELLDEPSDSGWRHHLGAPKLQDEDDLIIELD